MVKEAGSGAPATHTHTHTVWPSTSKVSDKSSDLFDAMVKLMEEVKTLKKKVEDGQKVIARICQPESTDSGFNGE